MTVLADLAESGQAIDVRFPYHPGRVVAIKEIPGRRFIPKDKGGPMWRVPLDLTTGRRLREAFGGDLQLGDALRRWGIDERDKQRNLGAIAKQDDYPLEQLKLARWHPELAQYLRPYQRADVAMMAMTNVLNGNQMGLGKTVEVIAAIVEADLLSKGPHLVIAPKTSHDAVWRDEIEKWLSSITVFTWSGDVKPADRKADAVFMRAHLEAGQPFFLVTNPDTVRRGLPIEPDEWATVTVDEFHKAGLTNASGDPSRGSKFAQAMRKLVAVRKYALSGTPMGGIPIKLWGVLHWLEPQEYTSKWRWADQWLTVTDNGFGKDVGGLKPGREDEFYASHARHMVRRLKREVMPQLPAHIYEEVWVPLTPSQKKQYDEFEAYAEIRIDEERLSGNGVLAEYTRLKQFANAKQRMEDGVPYPTEDSARLEYLWDKLDEQGIRPEDAAAGELALVGSESERFINVVAGWLCGRGLKVELITGKTKGDERTRIQREARDPTTRAQVICMTTTAGGLSINLQPANAVHVLDETWNPDDQAQLIERADRGSRETSLMVFRYYTKGTIQEDIKQVTEYKAATNENIMDIRRRIFKRKEAQG